MSEKKILIIIFFLAMLVRIGGNIIVEKVLLNKPFFFSGYEYIRSLRADEMWYDGAARAFLQGKGVVSMNKYNVPYAVPSLNVIQEGTLTIKHKMIDEKYYAHAVIAPLYPVFLGVCYFIGGFNTLAYFIPQVILGSLTCLTVYLLGKYLFGRKVAVLAGTAMVFYSDLVLWTYRIRIETLFIFLLTLGFLLFLKSRDRKNNYLVLISGAIFGLACLTRVALILFVPVLLAWQMFFFSRDARLNLKVSVMTALILFVVLSPWCARNLSVFGEFTPLTTETNVILLNTVDINDPDTESYLEASRYCMSYKSVLLRTGMYIKDHFREYVSASFKRFLKFWSPYTGQMKPSARLIKGLTWLIVFPAAFYGMAVSFKERRGSALLILFVIVYSLIHAFSLVDDGLVYRYPLLPFMCIFASYGFWTIYGKTKTYFCHNRP